MGFADHFGNNVPVPKVKREKGLLRYASYGVSSHFPSCGSISGDVLRKLLVQLENHVDLDVPLRLPPCAPSQAVKVRKRASRRAVRGVVDAADAEARAQRVAAQLMAWYNDHVGLSLLEYANVGQGRRIHIVDTPHVEVPRETGTYECSGVVRNDDGSRSRGYK